MQSICVYDSRADGDGSLCRYVMKLINCIVIVVIQGNSNSPPAYCTLYL